MIRIIFNLRFFVQVNRFTVVEITLLIVYYIYIRIIIYHT